MATKTKLLFAFEPDYAVPPGRTLLETIEHLGIDQKELAVRTGMAAKTINQIVKGKAPDESRPSETELESPSSANEKPPVVQGVDADCELVRIAEKQEPPLRLELRTYALRKRRSTN